MARAARCALTAVHCRVASPDMVLTLGSPGPASAGTVPRTPGWDGVCVMACGKCDRSVFVCELMAFRMHDACRTRCRFRLLGGSLQRGSATPRAPAGEFHLLLDGSVMWNVKKGGKKEMGQKECLACRKGVLFWLISPVRPGAATSHRARPTSLVGCGSQPASPFFASPAPERRARSRQLPLGSRNALDTKR